MRKRFEPSTELRRGTPHAFRHGAYLAVAPAQHGDDPIGLPKLVGAKNHCFVAVGRHLDIVPDVAKLSRTSERGSREPRLRQRQTPGRKTKAKPEPGVRQARAPTPHPSGARAP